jgi:predicted nicotinamide N-methyase
MNAAERIWTRNWSFYDGAHVVTYPMNFTPSQLLAQVRSTYKQFYAMPWVGGYLVSRYVLKRWERINKKYLCHLAAIKTPARVKALAQESSSGQRMSG